MEYEHLINVVHELEETLEAIKKEAEQCMTIQGRRDFESGSKVYGYGKIRFLACDAQQMLETRRLIETNLKKRYPQKIP